MLLPSLKPDGESVRLGTHPQHMLLAAFQFDDDLRPLLAYLANLEFPTQRVVLRHQLNIVKRTNLSHTRVA